MSNVFRSDAFMDPEEKPEPAGQQEQVEETADAIVAGAEQTAEAVEAVPEVPEETTEETPEVDWKKRYDDLRRLQFSQAEVLKQTEIEKNQLENALARAVPYLQQMAQTGTQPSDEELAKLGVEPETYKALEPLISQRVNAGLQTMQVQFEAQRQAQANAQQGQAISSAVESFFVAHPDVPKGSEMDDAIGDTVRHLASAWEAQGYEVGWDEPSLYEMAYEATKDPLLRDILAKNPQYAEDDEGLELARDLASLRQAKRSATQPKEVAPPPHVEHGGTTGPGSLRPATQDEDPWNAVKALNEQERKSVFTR